MLMKYRRLLGLVEMSSADARYTWKSKSHMKTKTKTSEEQTSYSLNRNADRLISENELLKKENARLQSERDILKKVSAGVPVVLFSTSN